MKTSPTCNDEALLLLVHGELPLSGQLRQYLHLAGCPACRARLQEYRSVSSQLAQGLAQPGHPPRLSAISGAPTLPAPLLFTTGLVVLIVAAVGALAWQWHLANPYALLKPAAVSTTIEECDPSSNPPRAGSASAPLAQRRLMRN